MSKGKSITLLSILSVIIAFVMVMSFIRFPIGVKNYNSLLGAVELDYDLEGGVAYTLTLSDENEEEVEDINAVVDVLEYRLGELGYGAYSVKAIKSAKEGVKDYAIRIETKLTDTIASDIEVVASYGQLEFFGGVSEEEVSTEILTDVNVIKSAKYKGEVAAGTYQIDIEFTQEGYDALMELVEKEEVYFLKVTLGHGEEHDGHSHENVLFQDQINASYFNKRTMPLYSADAAAAKQMALQMQNGGLPYIYEISDAVEIVSPYGEDIAMKCAIAVIALAVVLMAVLVIAYKGMGIVTALSSLLFILAEGWLLIGVPNIVVNMGSIVGILSAIVLNFIGMVILGKTVKEEYATGKKTVKASIGQAFKKVLVPTIGINVVAGLIALALFAFTAGLVKGFAITFGIGSAVAIFATLVFTRMYNALILPLYNNKESFLGKKDAEMVEEA